MKIFNVDGKINFVDDKNVFVGFDYREHCCENFGYLLTNKIPANMDFLESDIEENENYLDGYNFDKNFIKDLPYPTYYDQGEAKCFRLVKNRRELFLTIYNYHNGCYTHGFEFVKNENIIESGTI